MKERRLHSVIVVWYDPRKGEFEENIPLLWNGQRNLRRGSKNALTVVFLSGMTKLSPSYLTSLRSVGYTLVDAEPIYQEIAPRYPNLDHFGTYEKYCFIRWLVLKKLFPLGGIVQYDGDIVWNLQPEAIEKILQGKTLMLPGGPSFAAISDRTWFNIYARELTHFAKNPQTYGQDWRGSEFRTQIGSDQDLFDYLLQRKLLPQDTFPKSTSVFAENPLLLRDKLRADLAFWHMQTDYVHYLNLRYMLEPYGLSLFAPNPINTPPVLLKGIYLLGRLARRSYQSRRSMCEYFLSQLH